MIALVLTNELCQALINDLNPYTTAVFLSKINFKYAEKFDFGRGNSSNKPHTFHQRIKHRFLGITKRGFQSTGVVTIADDKLHILVFVLGERRQCCCCRDWFRCEGGNLTGNCG